MEVGPAYATARSCLGALIDGAPDHLVGEYACVLEELDGLCSDARLAASSGLADWDRAGQYRAARCAVESMAAGAVDRLGYQLCLARLDAAWDTEAAGSRR